MCKLPKNRSHRKKDGFIRGFHQPRRSDFLVLSIFEKCLGNSTGDCIYEMQMKFWALKMSNFPFSTSSFEAKDVVKLRFSHSRSF